VNGETKAKVSILEQKNKDLEEKNKQLEDELKKLRKDNQAVTTKTATQETLLHDVLDRLAKLEGKK
jgi:cell division protein FtsB